MNKKIIALLLGAVITCSMVACGSQAEQTPNDTETEAAASQSAPDFESTEALINSIYEIKPMELDMVFIPVDLAAEFALKAYLGLTPEDADKFVEATASEAMMGQACSIAVADVADTADVAEIAQKMANGIDQNKWVCVEADKLRVVTCDKYILLTMIDSRLDSVDDIVDAFTEVCGYTDGEYYKQ